MNKDMIWSQDNILILTAATTKKGGGINAIIGLLQDVLAFKDKLTAATEAQDIGEHKQKLHAFHKQIEEMYTSLLDMAKGGIQAVRQENASPQAPQAPQASGSSGLVDHNAIQKLP